MTNNKLFEKVTNEHSIKFTKIMFIQNQDECFKQANKFIDELIKEIDFKGDRYLLITYLNTLQLEAIGKLMTLE